MQNEIIGERLNFASSLSLVLDIILILLLIGNDYNFGIELDDGIRFFWIMLVIGIPVSSLVLARIAKNKDPRSKWATINTALSIILIVLASVLSFCSLADYGMRHIRDVFSDPFPRSIG